MTTSNYLIPIIVLLSNGAAPPNITDYPLKYTQAKTQASCYFKEHRLYGRIQIVNSFADIKVQVVTSFADLKVKVVESQPSRCGEWQMVNSFPDLKVQIVSSFPDLKIQFVESFPGVTNKN